MPVYRFEDLTPVVDPSAYVHPAAQLIGDVIIGAHCYVGPGASLRGDFGRVVMQTGSNVQDNCVVHSFPGQDAVIEDNGHIGHGAVLHGCVVRRDALVGMNAVVMDGVEVGEAAFVGAMSFVRAGFKVPCRSLVAGVPAKLIRELEPREIEWKHSGTLQYRELARRCLLELAESAPLAQVEEGRQRIRPFSATPLYRLKAED